MRPSTWLKPLLAAAGALALVLALAPAAVAQQTGTVSGTVTESGTNRPLAGVQLFVAGTTGPGGRILAISGDDGRYTLSNVPAGPIQVRARLVGYTSRSANLTLVAGQTADVDFDLTRSVIALDEIVVSGAGGQVEKKQLGNTIATVDVSNLVETRPIASFSEAIQGREPSVVGLDVGGLTGAGTKIRIRGSNSLSMSNEPVVYVDGVRVDNGGGLTGVGENVGGTSRLDDINPEAIERVEVLKGAAAATLYGSEASAGVIQIFTKAGSRGAPRFNFRIEQGISNYDAGRYKPNAGFARDAAQAATINETYGLNVQPFEVFERTFVKDMMETGYHQVYSGSVTGGGDDIQYFVSGRFTHDDGPFGGEEIGPARDINRKYQANTTLTVFPRDRLSFRFGAHFTDLAHETPNNGNNIFGVMPLAMFGKPENGNCTNGPTGRFLGETTPICNSPSGDPIGPGNPTGQAAFETVREAMQQVTRQDVEHFNTSLTATYQAATSVSIETTMGLDVTNERSSEFARFAYDVDDFTSNNTDGFKAIGSANNRELSLDIKGRWNERFGNLSSALVVGGQGFISSRKTSGGFGSTFPGPGLEVAEAAANQSLNEFELEIVNAGLFAQEQVGFNDWIFTTVGGRFDRNSAFGENEGAAFYPKASISIVPSDLNSWASDLLSTFRIRAAVGKSGLQPGAFDRLTTYQPGPTTVGPGLQPDNLGNQDLKPEKSTEWEVGTEMGLFQNRLGLEISYWNRTTKDALVRRQFPVTGGFTQQQLDNIGELSGKGIEIKADFLALDRENLSISLFANGSYLKEEVVSMGPAPPIKVGGSYPRYRNFLIEGFAPGSFFGAALVDFTPGSTVPFDTNGDGQADTEAEFRAFLGNNPEIGLSDAEMNPLLRDDDNDGDLLDHFLGKPVPDWQGAFGANVTLWNNLQVSAMMEYKFGNFQITNLTDAFRKSNPVIGRNTMQAATVEATLANPATVNDVDARFDAAMQWATQLKALAPYSGLNTVEDADYLRFRELGIVYTAPAAWGQKLGLSNLAFSLTGRNLALWTGYSGIDPEASFLSRCNTGGSASTDCNFGDGVDAFGLPVPTRWTAAVRFGF